MSRDWQEDLDMLKEADGWEFESTFDGEGNITKGTTTIAEYIGVSYAGTIFNTFEALKYWLQQYAAEKERGDDLQEELNDLNYKYEDLSERSLKRKFELAEEKERANMAYLAYKGLAADNVSLGEYESLLDKHTAMTKAYRAEKERADKLREAIDKAIREYGLWHDEGSAANVMVEILHNAVSSLYPKEETQ